MPNVPLSLLERTAKTLRDEKVKLIMCNSARWLCAHHWGRSECDAFNQWSDDGRRVFWFAAMKLSGRYTERELSVALYG